MILRSSKAGWSSLAAWDRAAVEQGPETWKAANRGKSLALVQQESRSALCWSPMRRLCWVLMVQCSGNSVVLIQSPNPASGARVLRLGADLAPGEPSAVRTLGSRWCIKNGEGLIQRFAA